MQVLAYVPMVSQGSTCNLNYPLQYTIIHTVIMKFIQITDSKM